MPMCVWLRGDEDSNDFTMTAEEVMVELNIKRSRLTQISGKELRVGRKRVERYVKPFYRHIDVLTYKEWTRASATRQRSAEIIEKAADDIEKRSERLLAKSQYTLSQNTDKSLLALQKYFASLLNKQQRATLRGSRLTQHTHLRLLRHLLVRLQKEIVTQQQQRLSDLQQTLLHSLQNDSTANRKHILQEQRQLLMQLQQQFSQEKTDHKEEQLSVSRDLQHCLKEIISIRDNIRKASAPIISRNYASIAPPSMFVQQHSRLLSSLPARQGWCSVEPRQ